MFCKLLSVMKLLLLLFAVFVAVSAQSQTISTFAGNGTGGSAGDGGPATNASIESGFGGFDKSGNYYFAERGYNKIRKVSASGIVSLIAGMGIAGSSGDSGLAIYAQLDNPIGVAADGSNNVYICDLNNNKIRKVNTVTGIVSTIAGNGVAGFSGDNGPATSASLNGPTDICADLWGNIFFSDRTNRVVRKINTSGVITTFAGTYNQGGYDGDGGLATLAKLYITEGICSDKQGNIFICNGDKVRKVDALTGIISTVAGNGTAGYSGDGGMATSAKLYHPFDVAVDNSDNIFIADSYNNRIRMVNSAGIINTVAGNGMAAFYGDNGLASLSKVNLPKGVALDTCGNLYFGDLGNNRIRKIAFNPSCAPLKAAPSENIAYNIDIYPIPASDQLVIEHAVGCEMKMYDVVGREVLRLVIKDTPQAIDISGLSSGVYMVQFSNDVGIKVVRVVKR
jgi:hypothetical protein